MSNVQLCLMSGIPTLLVLVGLVMQRLAIREVAVIVARVESDLPRHRAKQRVR